MPLQGNRVRGVLGIEPSTQEPSHGEVNPRQAPRHTRAPRQAPSDFRLPSGTMGALGWIDPAREAQDWARWAPIGRDPIDEDHDYWTFESAGFRAVLRLWCALVRLDRKLPGHLVLEDVEALSLPDFLFLDELYRVNFLAT